jgi:hypothetical protein
VKSIIAVTLIILIACGSFASGESRDELPIPQPDQASSGQIFLAPAGLIPGLDWLLKQKYYIQIITNLYFFLDILKAAYGYWKMLQGIAAKISQPGKFIKIIANDWKNSCLPQVPLPGFLKEFMDFATGRYRILYCDPGVMKYILEDLTGGEIRVLDINGNKKTSVNNNKYAMTRYEIARFFGSIGSKRYELERAAVKGSHIQYRVYFEKLNAARGLLDALAAMIKVQGLQVDIKASDLMFDGIEEQRKLRGQTFVDTANSAAIMGVFGNGEGSPASTPQTKSGTQNLFDDNQSQ